MYVTDNNGSSELITDFLQDSTEINRDLQGRYELNFTVVKTDKNEVAYNMIQDLVNITVEEEVFTVKIIEENPYSKNVVCLHEFFDESDTLLDYKLPPAMYTAQQIVNTFNSANTGWNFILDGSFNSFYLEDFGDDNIISLLNIFTQTFNAEYTVSSTGKRVLIKNSIGKETDYQIRYGHNLVAISKSIDASDVKTHIRIKYNQQEDGGYASSTVYISPLASYYPKPKFAKTVEYDTTSESLARIYGSTQIVDTPTISISVEFSELKNNGYEGDEIELGNYFYLIDERLSESQLARIVEIKTFPYSNKSPQLVLSNRVKYYTDISIKQQQEQLLLNDQAVKKGENLDGVILTEDNGIEVRAENNKQVKIYINAKEGFTILNGVVRKFYVDTQGNVTFDGRLNITNGDGVTKLLEAFLDTYGGILNIYNRDGVLNARMGAELGTMSNSGGTLTLHSPAGRRVEAGVLFDSGQINMRDPQGVARASIGASNGPNSNPYVGVANNSGTVVSYLTPVQGRINSEIIATRDWVEENFQPKNP